MMPASFPYSKTYSRDVDGVLHRFHTTFADTGLMLVQYLRQCFSRMLFLKEISGGEDDQECFYNHVTGIDPDWTPPVLLHCAEETAFY